jgi:hypothetical protein
MAGKSKSLSDALNGESGRKIVRKVLAETLGGVLDVIPSFRPDGAPLDPRAEIHKAIEKPRLNRTRRVNGRWYREDGTLFTTEEILLGKHLQRS